MNFSVMESAKEYLAGFRMPDLKKLWYGNYDSVDGPPAKPLITPASGRSFNSNTVGGVGSQQGTMEMNPLLSARQQQQRAKTKAMEIPLASIRFIQELGEGAFGKVYKGELSGFAGGTFTLVAIKTLKPGANQKTRSDFVRESELMTDLRHPNIVCLIGVCMQEEPQCMVFEHMAHGDLHEFLISHSPKSDCSIDSDLDIRVLTQSEMAYIAIQIAAGMEYLSSHHYVHRDLAARNTLVGENLTVKISDFGLSRDIYSADYYRVQSKSLLPVRYSSTHPSLMFTAVIVMFQMDATGEYLVRQVHHRV